MAVADADGCICSVECLGEGDVELHLETVVSGQGGPDGERFLSGPGAGGGEFLPGFASAGAVVLQVLVGEHGDVRVRLELPAAGEFRDAGEGRGIVEDAVGRADPLF